MLMIGGFGKDIEGTDFRENSNKRRAIKRRDTNAPEGSRSESKRKYPRTKLVDALEKH